MDYQPTTNNEDEFAKALNNLSGDTGSGDFFADNNNASYLENSNEAPAPTVMETVTAAEEPAPAPAEEELALPQTPFNTPAPAPVEPAPAPVVEPSPSFSAPEPTPIAPAPAGGGDLNSLKTSVLTDLRPVIENVSIEPDEKYGLLSTLFNANRDSTLIEPAYIAAREITDDTKRAEALLKIVHDIDSVN